VIDEEALSDLGSVVDLDSGQRPRRVGDRAWQHGNAAGVEGVRDAVGQERLDAGPADQHLDRADTERRGVALARGLDIAAQLARQARQ